VEYELDPRFVNFDSTTEVTPEDLNLSISKAWRSKKFSWAPFNKWWTSLSELQKEDFLPGVELIKQLENGKTVVSIKKKLPEDFIVRFVGGNNHTLVKDLARYKTSGDKVFIPFAGSGREVYRFAQQGKSVTAADTQFLSLCLVQGVLVGSGAVDVDFDIPDFQKGVTVNRQLFDTTEEIAGYIDSYASLYKDNLFALAVLANSIVHSFFWGYVADHAKFLIKTVAEFKDDLQTTHKRLLKYYGTCPSAEFHWGSYTDLKVKADLVFVDPPKIIGDSDIYSEKFGGLNSVLVQKDVTLPVWTSEGYLDKFQKIFDTPWQTLLFVYTSDVYPTVAELEECLENLGTVRLVKTYKMGKRTDYLFSVTRN